MVASVGNKGVRGLFISRGPRPVTILIEKLADLATTSVWPIQTVISIITLLLRWLTIEIGDADNHDVGHIYRADLGRH